MLLIDEKDNNHIYTTRGDDLVFDIELSNDDGSLLKFNPTDCIKMGIYEVEGLDRSAVLLKEFEAVEEEANIFRISIPGEEMKIGKLTNEIAIYWYEITYNDTRTLVGHEVYEDEMTEKKKIRPAVITLLPEGSETK